MAGLAVMQRNAEADAGTGGHQRHVGTRRADGLEVGIRHRVDHGGADAFRLESGNAFAYGGRAARHHVVFHQPDLVGGLWLQHAHQVGIGHRCERVVLHAGLGEQHVAHIQIATKDGAAILGEGRAGDGEIGAELFHQCIHHRADVALGCGVEG